MDTDTVCVCQNLTSTLFDRFQTLYQTGVFISRSSVNVFPIDKIWLLSLLQVKSLSRHLVLQVKDDLFAVGQLCVSFLGGSFSVYSCNNCWCPYYFWYHSV